ncbi:MAG: hypothetical protein AAGG59_16155 [Bacteroidota bacterium]
MPDKFEEEWRAAFEDAEMPPGSVVWDKVELAVANSANGNFKRRIFVFKLMAAASIAFALTIGGIGIYREFYMPKNDRLLSESKQLSTNSTGSQNKAEERMETADPEGSSGNETIVNENKKRSKALDHDPESNEDFERQLPVNSEKHRNDSRPDDQVLPDENVTNSQHLLSLGIKKQGYNSKGYNSIGTKDTDLSEAGPVNLGYDNESDTSEKGRYEQIENDSAIPEKLEKLMAELDSFSFSDPELSMVPWYSGAIVNTKKDVESAKFWAGLGMSGGSFNPTGGATSGNSDEASFSLNEDSFTQSAQSPLIGEEENGRVINIGLNFGTRIAPKWMLQSGIVLIDRSTTNTSNIAQNTGSSLRAVNDFSELSNISDLSVVGTYDIDNSYRFISVPVQAGYILVDRKFGITLLGGVSNDLFLKKSVDGENDGFQEYDVDEGIRTYNITGLLGTELGYRIGSQYLIALTPQIRQAINSTTISGDKVRPTFFELGFRFKYLLK